MPIRLRTSVLKNLKKRESIRSPEEHEYVFNGNQVQFAGQQEDEAVTSQLMETSQDTIRHIKTAEVLCNVCTTMFSIFTDALNKSLPISTPAKAKRGNN
jgi:hypothetical protein